MVLKFPHNICAVVHMNMSMDQIFGMIAVYQVQKAFKSAVSIVSSVTISGRRRVSHDYIDTTR